MKDVYAHSVNTGQWVTHGELPWEETMALPLKAKAGAWLNQTKGKGGTTSPVINALCLKPETETVL